MTRIVVNLQQFSDQWVFQLWVEGCLVFLAFFLSKVTFYLVSKRFSIYTVFNVCCEKAAAYLNLRFRLLHYIFVS